MVSDKLIFLAAAFLATGAISLILCYVPTTGLLNHKKLLIEEPPSSFQVFADSIETSAVYFDFSWFTLNGTDKVVTAELHWTFIMAMIAMTLSSINSLYLTIFVCCCAVDERREETENFLRNIHNDFMELSANISRSFMNSRANEGLV